MNIYVWRHNRKYHSWSMISEPCINEHFYNDAVAVVQAESEEEALGILANSQEGWLVEEIRRLSPKVYPAGVAGVIFCDIRGN